jgi:hypothetical protein
MCCAGHYHLLLPRHLLVILRRSHFPTIHFNSEKDDSKIDILDMMKCITEKAESDFLKTRLYYRLDSAVAKDMTDGTKYLVLPSDMKAVEVCIKDAKICTSTTNRDKILCSIYVMVQSIMVHPCIAIAAAAKKVKGDPEIQWVHDQLPSGKGKESKALECNQRKDHQARKPIFISCAQQETLN